jgi:hypothetical protein
MDIRDDALAVLRNPHRFFAVLALRAGRAIGPKQDFLWLLRSQNCGGQKQQHEQSSPEHRSIFHTECEPPLAMF